MTISAMAVHFATVKAVPATLNAASDDPPVPTAKATVPTVKEIVDAAPTTSPAPFRASLPASSQFPCKACPPASTMDL